MIYLVLLGVIIVVGYFVSKRLKPKQMVESKPEIFNGVVFGLLTDQQKRCYNYILSCLQKDGSNSGMTDEEFNQYVNAKIEEMDLFDRSKKLLNIDEDQIKEIDKIQISGFAGYTDDESAKCVFPGKDGTFRNRYYDTTYIHFGEYQLYIYYCRIDVLSDNKEETTSEFFYKDITNVEKLVTLSQWSKKVTSGCLNQETDVKQVGVYRGFAIYVPNSSYSKFTIFQPGIDESIDGMIAKIRDKKNR